MASGKGSMKKSNLDRFLHCTTPSVPPQEFFRLSDLWDCYDEWSAYGASVPIHLSNRESLVQYYVPYLSAIQIFTSPSSLLRLREESEDGESDGRYPPFSDSGSDESVSEERLENNPNDRLGYLYLQYHLLIPEFLSWIRSMS
ncbi:BnaC08g46240D [Brassica napus]|uniref:BnaC08g46240D protein n=1 Tax=Brassica napus TaxID=3708 RepID=A0A078IN75_BRANA|nr:BnaC08g46240D [Brassica napus]